MNILDKKISYKTIWEIETKVGRLKYMKSGPG
jgi:hypothetical protein